MRIRGGQPHELILLCHQHPRNPTVPKTCIPAVRSDNTKRETMSQNTEQPPHHVGATLETEANDDTQPGCRAVEIMSDPVCPRIQLPIGSATPPVRTATASGVLRACFSDHTVGGTTVVCRAGGLSPCEHTVCCGLCFRHKRQAPADPVGWMTDHPADARNVPASA